MYTRKHTYVVSKIIEAPILYVYEWCTDFQESDPKLTSLKNKRIILFRTKDRVVYVSQFVKHGQLRNAVYVVTLYPKKKAWHLDYHGDGDDEVGEYALVKLSAKRTRLNMTFKDSYKIRNPPSKSADSKRTNEMWDKYVTAIEKDYARSQRT